MVGTIYKLTSPSGKSYIGQTMNISIRRRTFKNLNAYILVKEWIMLLKNTVLKHLSLLF